VTLSWFGTPPLHGGHPEVRKQKLQKRNFTAKQKLKMSSNTQEKERAVTERLAAARRNALKLPSVTWQV